MYGSELLDLNCNYVKDFTVACRKVKRRIWKLPYRAHNAIVHNLSYDIDLHLDTRIIMLVHLGLNHSNNVCKSILLTKICCIIFLKNGWFKDVSHLMRIKFQQNFRSRNKVQT